MRLLTAGSLVRVQQGEPKKAVHSLNGLLFLFPGGLSARRAPRSVRSCKKTLVSFIQKLEKRGASQKRCKTIRRKGKSRPLVFSYFLKICAAHKAKMQKVSNLLRHRNTEGHFAQGSTFSPHRVMRSAACSVLMRQSFSSAPEAETVGAANSLLEKSSPARLV